MEITCWQWRYNCGRIRMYGVDFKKKVYFVHILIGVTFFQASGMYPLVCEDLLVSTTSALRCFSSVMKVLSGRPIRSVAS